MFGLFKRKKLHKKNHFIRRKLGDDGQYCYYNQNLNQWMLWSQICDNTDFKSEDELKGSTLLAADKVDTKCDLKRDSSITEFTEKVDSFLDSVDLLSEYVDLEFGTGASSRKEKTRATPKNTSYKAQKTKRPYRESHQIDSSSSLISTASISNSISSSYGSSSDCSGSSYSGGGDSGGCF